MKIPVSPSLKNTSRDLLTEADVVWQIIEFSIYNPGETTEMLEPAMLSLKYLEAQVNGEKEALASEYAIKLQAAVTNALGTNAIRVSVEAEQKTDITFHLIIKITDKNGALLLNNNVRVIATSTDKGLVYDLQKFNGMVVNV